MADIVVLGSINMDIVARTARIPLAGETVSGRDLAHHPGGKGANQAVAASRAGGRVAMVGRIGDDGSAATLRAALIDSGVDTAQVHGTHGVASGTALIVVDDSGRNSIVVVPGANGQLTPDDVHTAEALIAGARILLLQLEVPLATVEAAAALARQHGVRVVLNPAPAQTLPATLLQNVDVLIPNQHEAALLAGAPPDSAIDLGALAASLHAQGPATVIVTLGADGAFVSHGPTQQHVPGFAVRVVDTTAAGDCFVGGLAVALVEGQPLSGAVRFANACGALATTRAGAQPSLPVRGAVEGLMSE